MYYVYILRSLKDVRSIYIGFTDDIERRTQEHNSGRSTYTSKQMPWRLAYYEAYASQADAMDRERQLKHFANAWAQLRKRIRNSLS